MEKESTKKSVVFQEKPFVSMSAHECFKVLRELVDKELNSDTFMLLYELMQGVCNDLTYELHFANFFSRLDYVCKKFHVKNVLETDVQNLRRRYRLGQMINENRKTFLYDLKTVTDFISCVFEQPAPESLLQLLPRAVSRISHKSVQEYYKCLRVLVKRWDDRYIYAVKDADGTTEICIDYRGGGIEDDLFYLKDLLEEGLLLNLLKVKIDKQGHYVPVMIIVWPDCLIDVSSLAACFKPYGHDERNFILQRISPKTDTPYTLLGGLASQFLDDLIYETPQSPATYADSLKKAFCNMPIPFALQDMNAKFDFHKTARSQFVNLKHIVEEELTEKYGFDKEKALIEPSFVCESLGLSGRMDYLQSDGLKLVEQKSGKMDEWHHTHREPHFVQMMLYQAILEQCLDVSLSKSEVYLLYSRYPEGLLREKVYVRLLREALALRNRIVIQEKGCARGCISSIFQNLSPDALNKAGEHGKLWSDYERPELAKLLRPFKLVGDDTEQKHQKLLLDYFYRFYTFICREQLLGKEENTTDLSYSFSNLWNDSYLTRTKKGDMYCGLKLKGKEEKNLGYGCGIDLLTFCLPKDGNASCSNFRKGDAVLLYSYSKNEEPDVRHGFVIRGKLCSISDCEIIVELNHGQRNRQIFVDKERLFALEHDYVESSSEMLYQGLYSFLTAPRHRQDLLLNQRKPLLHSKAPLLGDYGRFNSVVQKERCSLDFFLVIGPPGSGKTSCALRYMVEEELRVGTKHLLLMAYTNRAVDELCSMLEKICRNNPHLLSDYLRIGGALSTDETYRSHLLGTRCLQINKSSEVRDMLVNSHVIVGTTTSLSAQDLLLKAVHFDVAFVDEASQILEPGLLKLLCSATDSCCSIDRFVLVGDQKQLPAIVRQSVTESNVEEKSLCDIGLSNCRNSLFERLLVFQERQANENAYSLLNRQGRMHPELFRFVNAAFYREKLECVPLEHQRRSLQDLYPSFVKEKEIPLSTIEKLMFSHRICFIDVKPHQDEINDKINSAEAQLTARLIQSYVHLNALQGCNILPTSIGVIVPYRNQISMIRSCMESMDHEFCKSITIDTVERYQGSQREFIVYPFTVKYPYQLNFLAAATYLEENDSKENYWVDRKLNVALTRAREQLFLVGNADLLCRNSVYRLLINKLNSDGNFVKAKDLK